MKFLIHAFRCSAMTGRKRLLLAALLVLAPLAQAAGRSDRGPNPTDYARFAKEAVEQVRFAHIQGWEPIDDEHVVLFVSYSKAFMLDLSGPCFQLDRAFSISVTSFGNRIESGFDKVLAGTQSCRITQIRKIDLDAYRAARRQVTGVLEAGTADQLLAVEAVERPKDAPVPAADQ